MTFFVSFVLCTLLMLAIYRLLGGKLERTYPYVPRHIDGSGISADGRRRGYRGSSHQRDLPRPQRSPPESRTAHYPARVSTVSPRFTVFAHGPRPASTATGSPSARPAVCSASIRTPCAAGRTTGRSTSSPPRVVIAASFAPRSMRSSLA